MHTFIPISNNEFISLEIFIEIIPQHQPEEEAVEMEELALSLDGEEIELIEKR